MKRTARAALLSFFIGWNLHTLFSSLGPEALKLINVHQTEIGACLSDLVAKILYCSVATYLRVQVGQRNLSLTYILDFLFHRVLSLCHPCKLCWVLCGVLN